MTEELRQVQNQMESISTESLEDKLSKLDLPAHQMAAIKECLSAAKFNNKKNRCYTEGWLLTCLPLHIRSPSGYAFLRNDILPLPAISTVRKYLSMVRVECIFDKHFFAALKKKVAHLDSFQRHGILIFDEIHVRKELKVNSKTMNECTSLFFPG